MRRLLFTLLGFACLYGGPLAADATRSGPTAIAGSTSPVPPPGLPATGSTAVPAPISTAPSGLPTGQPAPVVSPPLPSPHGVSPHGMPAHGSVEGLLLTGSPFASEQHRMQAALARRGRSLFAESGIESNAMVPHGTIAILVQDGQKRPLAKTRVKLHGIQKSISEGDKEFSLETITDDQGRCAFRDQGTDTNFSYEVVVEQDGAVYSSGSFGFEHQRGVIVSLHVFPVTSDIGQAFVFSRALYAIEPRSDVFQVQALYRVHNASPTSFRANQLPIRMPPGAQAFQPGNAADLQLRQEDQRVLLSGTFPPGQKEFTFSFQLPNERESSATLQLPLPPNLVDAKVVVESSPQMTLEVAGFKPSQKTLSPNGQPALIADQDFLVQSGHAPSVITAHIRGIPPKSNAPALAALVAGGLVLLGLGQALSRKRGNRSLAEEDRVNATRRLFDELVALERAKDDGTIGPKTYEQAKRALLDALARLEASQGTRPAPSQG